VQGFKSTTVGGEHNSASGMVAVAVSGRNNSAEGQALTAVGGFNVTLRGTFATSLGGAHSVANEDLSTVISVGAYAQSGHQGALVLAANTMAWDPNSAGQWKAPSTTCKSTGAGSLTMCALSNMTMSG
jgi:hypothetical protein